MPIGTQSENNAVFLGQFHDFYDMGKFFHDEFIADQEALLRNSKLTDEVLHSIIERIVSERIGYGDINFDILHDHIQLYGQEKVIGEFINLAENLFITYINKYKEYFTDSSESLRFTLSEVLGLMSDGYQFESDIRVLEILQVEQYYGHVLFNELPDLVLEDGFFHSNSFNAEKFVLDLHSLVFEENVSTDLTNIYNSTISSLFNTLHDRLYAFEYEIIYNDIKSSFDPYEVLEQYGFNLDTLLEVYLEIDYENLAHDVLNNNPSLSVETNENTGMLELYQI